MNVLVVNAGSSSLKYQLFDTGAGIVRAKGLCERIGIDGRISHKNLESGASYEQDIFDKLSSLSYNKLTKRKYFASGGKAW